MVAPDYFEIMGVPRRLHLDLESLRQRFYDLSRRMHPDNFAGRSPQEVERSTRNAAILNQAYRTLRDPLTRAAYLVERAGAPKPIQDPAFLMEMMEIQETLEEGSPADLAAALEGFRARVAGLDRDLEAIFAAWDALGEDPREADREALLARIQDNLATRRYFQNVIRDVTARLCP